MTAPGGKHYNVFQRLIRQWDTIHPYNAAQLMRLRGQLDPQKLEACWQSTIDQLGLSPTRVTATRFRERADDATLPAVQVLDPNFSNLDSHLSEEMNRPFGPAGEQPLRPFVLDNRDGTFWAGVVYQHWVADSVSIRVVLREWFYRMYEPQKARRSPLPIARRGYWHRFGPWRANWSLLGGMWSALTWMARLKFCRRPAHRDVTNYSARFAMHRFPAGIVPKLVAHARSKGVTLNDLFLAALVRVSHRHIAALPNWRKHHLAVGTIVDLRSTAPRGAMQRDEFGLFLGFTSALVRYRHRNDWEQIVKSVGRQSAQLKQNRAAEVSMIRIASAVAIGKIFHGENLMEWYRKRIPLCAGISNVNLNRTWVAEAHPQLVLDYLRVSPVGPMLPVVFTPSTLGDDLQFGLTWRDAIIKPDVAEKVAREFIQQLISIVTF